MIRRQSKKVNQTLKEKKVKSLRLKNQLRKSIQEKQKLLWTPPTGDGTILLSTGSLLLDLAISGRRFYGGGIPFGIFVEIFGSSSRGKTVMLLEMAGNIQKMGGDYLFIDPEARVNKTFAKKFDFDLEGDKYHKSNTAKEAFTLIKNWKPKGPGPFAIFADSLAAFSSEEEADGKGDEYSGARKAKEFSQQFRTHIRHIEENNYVFVATNQERQIMGANQYQQKTKATGGNAPEYYASLRLQLKKPAKDGTIEFDRTVYGVSHKRKIGVGTQVYVYKSTVEAPHQEAEIRILFDYGIDDLTMNLMYLKRSKKSNTYVLGDKNIGRSISEAVEYIENNNLEAELREEVIQTWIMIQEKLTPIRKKKVRF